jgi:hypothetical protein
VIVSVASGCQAAELLSPDSPRDPPRLVQSGQGRTELEVPRLKIYTLLILHRDRGLPVR